MRTNVVYVCACIVLLVLSTTSGATVTTRTGTFAGLQVSYQVVLPRDYDPAKAYPTILAFTGGSQDRRGVERMIEANWRTEAERRGYIVISPATPTGELFFAGADRIFPAFLDQILRDYRVAGRLHVAGLSNGGVSAFHIAAKYPSYFSSITGYPGLLDGPDLALAPAIRSMCVFMHVGDRDTGWRSSMLEQAQSLRAKGYSIRFTIEPNEDHIIRAADLGARLFDEIESCTR